ncbi:hypothetical protein [Antarcticirhabdus aurantiaca]|uniref:Uncharacterized protein n=1 Tax=Antarcticirhabdus aurantiaca TaxID=2606717 RepID=A0ACD4NVZ6_9HYPH|nr:hypothetical protein OXU80_12375 [Jeongeuplla avenae]
MDTGIRLRWSDIGKATNPGDYRVGNILISVTAFDIEAWKARPSGRFCVIATDEMSGRFYSLGAMVN